MDFAFIGEAVSLGRREGFLARSDAVDVVLVYNQTPLARLGISFIEHTLDEASPVLPRATFAHLDVAVAGQRLDFNQNGDARCAHTRDR